MTIPFEEITSFMVEMKQIEDERQLLEKRQKNLEKEILAAFADHLNAVYKNWRPGIGERVVVADFRSNPPYLFEAMVKVVDGNRCKMLTTLMDTGNMVNYLVHLLDEDLRNYELPLLTLPMDEYKKMKQKMDLPDFKPLS